MRIVKEEPEDPHTHLKELSKQSESISLEDASEDEDPDSLLDDIDIID